MTPKRKILYISTLCSSRVWDYLFNTSESKPGQAVQKFHYLLASGLAAMHENGIVVETLSSIPVVPK